MALTRTAKKVRPLNGALVRPNCVLGEEGELGEAVYLADDGKWYLSRGNLAASARVKGLIATVNSRWGGISAPADGEVGVCVFGPMAGFTDMTEDNLVFVSSATAGAVTQTAPSGAGTWTHEVGYPLASDVLFVYPDVNAPASNS